MGSDPEILPVVAPERESVEQLLRRSCFHESRDNMEVTIELILSFDEYRARGFSVEESCWMACEEWGV